jgi:hypothetical protein
VCKIVHTLFAAATEFSYVFLMADTSSYSIEERLVASVWVHKRQHTGQTMSQVMAPFRERFNKAPPRRATLLDWYCVLLYWSVYGDFSATLYNAHCFKLSKFACVLSHLSSLDIHEVLAGCNLHVVIRADSVLVIWHFQPKAV